MPSRCDLKTPKSRGTACEQAVARCLVVLRFCVQTAFGIAQRWYLDRGRNDRFHGRPSLRTARAVLPHTALRLVVAFTGLGETEMGLSQAPETEIREVGIGPAMCAALTCRIHTMCLQQLSP